MTNEQINSLKGKPITLITRDKKKIKAFIAAIDAKVGMTIHILDKEKWTGEECNEKGECFCLDLSKESLLYNTPTKERFLWVCKRLLTKKTYNVSLYEKKFILSHESYFMTPCAFSK